MGSAQFSTALGGTTAVALTEIKDLINNKQTGLTTEQAEKLDVLRKSVVENYAVDDVNMIGTIADCGTGSVSSTNTYQLVKTQVLNGTGKVRLKYDFPSTGGTANGQVRNSNGDTLFSTSEGDGKTDDMFIPDDGVIEFWVKNTHYSNPVYFRNIEVYGVVEDAPFAE